MDTHPIYVEQQRRGGKARCFRLAIPLAVFAYPLPKYLEKAGPIGGFNFYSFQPTFLPKTFPHVGRAFIELKPQKSPHSAGLHTKKQILQRARACARLPQTILGCRDTSSSSTTASAGKKPRAKASCGSTQRRFWPSSPQGSPANSVT